MGSKDREKSCSDFETGFAGGHWENGPTCEGCIGATLIHVVTIDGKTIRSEPRCMNCSNTVVDESSEPRQAMSMHTFSFKNEEGTEFHIALGMVQGCADRPDPDQHGNKRLFVSMVGVDDDDCYVIEDKDAARFMIEWKVFRVRIDQSMWAPMSNQDVLEGRW